MHATSGYVGLSRLKKQRLDAVESSGAVQVLGMENDVLVVGLDVTTASILAAGRPLTVVKVSKPGQDMRFDVPVVGLPTIEVMQHCGATALGIDAGRTLLFDRADLIAAADRAGIAIDSAEPSPAVPGVAA